jgi:DNA-binding NarL/FixJ family response regulator
MPKSRIIIIDDHQLFGLGLKELLLKQENYEVFGPFRNIHEINSAIQTYDPMLLLLDINLNGINGLELGKKLKVDYPNLKIIMLTMYEHVVFLKQSKDFGLDGYLLKDSEPRVLIGGINTVLNGGNCFLEIAEAPNDEMKDAFADKHKLSEREIEISCEICKGLNNNEIAEKLCLSYHTIKTHRKNIYSKLKISHVTELIEILNI